MQRYIPSETPGKSYLNASVAKEPARFSFPGITLILEKNV